MKSLARNLAGEEIEVCRLENKPEDCSIVRLPLC